MQIMLRKSLLFLLVIMMVVVPAAAQDAEVVVDGLVSPRGIAFDEEGNLYVAEAGSGGEKVLLEIEGTTVSGGLTSQVSMITPDGSKSVAVGNLTSATDPFAAAALGVIRALPAGDSLWLVLSDAQGMTVFSDAIVEIDKTTTRVKTYIDLRAYEEANNPDGTEEILSNPADIEFGPDGKLYIVDTGANTLFTWTEAEDLQVVHAWSDNSVPTSIEFAENGDIYIGFLGQGLAPGGGKIEHWSADGSELLETFPGLTNVTDILLSADGSLYAVQLMILGEQGPEPSSGSVVQVTDDGITPVLEGLDTPYGIAQDGEGNIIVTTNTAFGDPTAGTIVRVPAGS
jgi:glucose/arabinose dehydrogenase